MNAKDSTASMELNSRDALAPVFADLSKYDATTHFVGQSTIFTLTDDRATGEAYCLAHHVTVDSGNRRLMVASLRYHDTFVKIDGAWLFSERRLLSVQPVRRSAANAEWSPRAYHPREEVRAQPAPSRSVRRGGSSAATAGWAAASGEVTLGA
jgi:hypothetical protein